VLYHLVGPHGGTVVGIEHIPVLTAFAESNIRADGLGAALDGQVVVLVTGDGRLGASSCSPSAASRSSMIVVQGTLRKAPTRLFTWVRPRGRSPLRSWNSLRAPGA
jgi:protein-L-isoaspartate O-methyltransferase